MPRFSDTTFADASIEKAWDTLQDPGVWGALLGAAEISDIAVEDGLLQSSGWMAKIGGTELSGTMHVAESEPGERMLMRIQAEEWRGKIEVTIAAEDDGRTRVHARLKLEADGFTAMLALPIVSAVIGRHLPDRMAELAEFIESA
ncbi:MAG: SRPBCC family protein [Acidimicrobiia bacterium]|nr:SRPBCC family protein [Acidimicrobiia bacterium]